MNANFARLDSKTITRICRVLIVLTLVAYVVDIVLIDSPSFSSWNFKNKTILTDFNIFIIVFVAFFFVFAVFFECFYNLKEKIKTKILRYVYIAIAGLISCLAIYSCILMILDISRFVEIEAAIAVFGVITSLALIVMFVFMFIDKILCKARGQ